MWNLLYLRPLARSTNREDHLKALYALGEAKGGEKEWVSTNEMANHLGMKAPSVTNMVQVLQELGWAEHRPYRGARLTHLGRELALGLVRKHRLWETFLVDRLGFGWEAVHDIAEQLEHIDCPELVERLDVYLGNPKLDPHGDPIPDSTGAIVDNRELIRPVEWKQEGEVVVKAVLDDSHEALTNLDRHGLSIGTVLTAKHLAQLPNEMKAQLLVAPHHSNH